MIVIIVVVGRGKLAAWGGAAARRTTPRERPLPRPLIDPGTVT